MKLQRKSGGWGGLVQVQEVDKEDSGGMKFREASENKEDENKLVRALPDPPQTPFSVLPVSPAQQFALVPITVYGSTDLTVFV